MPLPQGCPNGGAWRSGGPKGWGAQRSGGADPEKVRALRVGAQRVADPKGWARRVGREGWAPEGWGLEGWGGPKGGEAQHFALLFPLPLSSSLFFSLSLSLGVFSLNFGGVFEGRDPQNVHVWSSRAVV